MSSDIELGVAEMFRDATMQSTTLDLRTQGDWDRFKEIQNTARQKEKRELSNFDLDRPELLAKARKELIDKAGALSHEHPTPFGTDRFAKSAINERANAKVENDHQQRLLKITSEESEGYSALRDEIQSREGNRDRAREAFARSTDRRSGTERRMPSQSR